MKRMGIFFGVLIAAFFAGTAFAENVDSIKFRDIDWLKPETEVKEITDKIDGAHESWYMGVEENARIDSWYRQWENMYTDYNIESAGTILRYDDVSVAGYNSELEISFMYPVENGEVIHNTEESLFYMAQYSIVDIEDYESAYEDIVNKLTSLYGTPTDKSYYNTMDELDSPKGSLWTASDGSLVWAGIYYSSYNEKYDACWIVYAAPNTEEMLTSLAEALQNESYLNEASNREENSSNTDGL